MSSRDRKRIERRKRKERSVSRTPEEGPATNAVAAAPPNHSKCFTSSTPMEAARGIRHWSGGC